MLIEYRGKNEDRQQRIFDKVVLIDGFNDVNPTEWKSAIANPHIKKKIESLEQLSIIVIHSEDHANQSLEDKSIPDAVKVIKETFDVGLLQEWKDHETRKGVLKALEDQLSQIENPTPAEKEAK
jgi:hypothetical protein